MSSALLCVLPLVPQKPSGGFWSFATAGWLWLEMRTMEQVLALLVLISLILGYLFYLQEILSSC